MTCGITFAMPSSRSLPSDDGYAVCEQKHLVEKLHKTKNKLDLDYHKTNWPSDTRAETHAGRACVETYTADIVITDTGRSVLYGHGPGAYCSQARMNTYKIDRPKAQSVYNNCGIINHSVMHRVK